MLRFGTNAIGAEPRGGAGDQSSRSHWSNLAVDGILTQTAGAGTSPVQGLGFAVARWLPAGGQKIGCWLIRVEGHMHGPFVSKDVQVGVASTAGLRNDVIDRRRCLSGSTRTGRPGASQLPSNRTGAPPTSSISLAPRLFWVVREFGPVARIRGMTPIDLHARPLSRSAIPAHSGTEIMTCTLLGLLGHRAQIPPHCPT